MILEVYGPGLNFMVRQNSKRRWRKLCSANDKEVVYNLESYLPNITCTKICFKPKLPAYFSHTCGGLLLLEQNKISGNAKLSKWSYGFFDAIRMTPTSCAVFQQCSAPHFFIFPSYKTQHLSNSQHPEKSWTLQVLRFALTSLEWLLHSYTALKLLMKVVQFCKWNHFLICTDLKLNVTSY